MLIKFTSYKFEPPHYGGYIHPFPVSPLKKHPLGFLTIILVFFPLIILTLFGVEADDFVSEAVIAPFVILIGVALLSGSLFSAISYSYYYFRCVRYNKKLDKIDSSNSNVNVKEESIPDQIKKLSELKDLGILSEEEFTAKKQELLNKM